MKVKSHKTFSVSPEVQRMFETYKERGYDSQSEMLEAAVRRLCGEEPAQTFDRAAIELVCRDVLEQLFAYERPMLAAQIQADVCTALIDRFEPQIPDDDPIYDFQPEPEPEAPAVVANDPEAAKPSWKV